MWNSPDLSNTSIQMTNLALAGQDNGAADVWSSLSSHFTHQSYIIFVLTFLWMEMYKNIRQGININIEPLN